MYRIQETLARGAGTPHTDYDKEALKNQVLEVGRLLDTLKESNSSTGANLDVIERDPEPTSADPHDAAVTIASPSVRGTSNSPTLTNFACSTDFSRIFLPQPKRAACERLIRREFALHEFPSLIETISSKKDEDEMIHHIPAADAQTFIDVVDEVRSVFT